MVHQLNTLPYPTQTVTSLHGTPLQEVVIPQQEQREVLLRLYPFLPLPSLEERIADLHTGKEFTVKEFRVFRDGEVDFLTSPWFPEGGGTVIDWVPAGWSEQPQGLHIDEVRPEHAQALLYLLEQHAFE